MQEDRFVPLGDLLEKARAQLPVGGLIHGEAFSMFEAMSALEIGSEKMDAGLTATPKSLDQLLEEGVAPIDLPPATVLGVMDKLLALEGTWHKGGSLAQTVFSCLYMLRPNRLTGPGNLCLLAFCSSLKASCVAVRVLIMQGGVVEEEDFNPNVFGLPMDEAITLTSANDEGESDAALTSAVLYCLERKTGAARAGDVKLESVFGALISRLRFRLEMSQGLAALLTEDISPSDLDTALHHFSKASACIKEIEETSTATAPTESTTVPAAASDQGTASADADVAAPCGVASVPGFDDNVNRQLLSPGPPRLVKMLSGDDVWTHYTALLQHLMAACSVSSVKDYASMKLWVSQFSHLRSGPVPRSAAHYLCLAKTWGGANAGEAPPDSTLDGTADTTPPLPVLPPWVIQRDMMCTAVLLPTSAAIEGPLGTDVEMFLEQSVIAVCNWCQAMLMNSSRQRRRLRRGLEDWGNLYQHALNADMSPEYVALAVQMGWRWTEIQDDPQGPLGTWVELETAAVMLSHLMIGFELEMYEPKEYGMVYWYCASLFNSRQHALGMLLAAMPPEGGSSPNAKSPGEPSPKGGLKPLSARGGKGQSAKGAEQKAKEAEQKAKEAAQKLLPDVVLETRRNQYTFEAVQSEGKQYMCQGLLRLLLGLNLAGAISDPELPFNTAMQRFGQRFSSFHAHIARPDPLGYDSFLASTDVHTLTPEMLLQLAMESFMMVRKAVQLTLSSPKLHAPLNTQLVTDFKQMDRVACQNALACSIIARSLLQKQEQEGKKEGGDGSTLKGGSKMDMVVKYDFSQSRNFPTIGVKSGAPAKERV